MRPRIVLLVVLGALAGCGSSSDHAARPAPATIVLDFTPNAVHAGIYDALAHRYPQRHGVDLHIQVPGSTTDAVKLLAAGRVQFAILDIHDLAIARAKGIDLVGVMAIVQSPLAAVVAQPKIANPAELDGQTVGVTGVPSDEAVLHSIVSGAGGRPATLHEVNIGFNAVPDLLANRVAGATAFWNDEGVTLMAKRPGTHVFRVEQYGAPAYPELIVSTSRHELQAHPAVVAGTVRALIAGYDDAMRHPAAAVHSLTAQVRGLDPKLVATQFHALLPAFVGRAPTYGDVDPARLRPWARWEARFGIVKRVPDTAAMFDNRYVRAAS